jgi:PmbA protein
VNIDDVLNRFADQFDSYELFFLKEKTKKFESRDRDLYGVDMNEEEGIALRGIKEGKMVFSFTFEKGDKAIDALLDNSKTLIPFVEADEGAILPGQYSKYPSANLFDEVGLATKDEEKTSRLVKMESLILDYDKRIVTTRNCEIQEAAIEIEIVNSRGLHVHERKTVYSIFALCVAKDEDEVSWYDWAWSHSLADIDMEALGMNVARKTISFLGSKQIDTGTYDAILTPQASCEILGVLSGSFLAESLYKNKTRLKDRVGEKCFAETVNIIDSGLAGMGAFPFDGEGVPSRENVIVENGVFMSFLYDTYYGKKYSKPSTGNAARFGLKDPPVCGRRGLYLNNGNADIYPHLNDGVIIEELMGTHTANPITGDFSLGAVGHLVRGGHKTPFKGVILSGNIYELLNSVKEIGSDLRFYGTCGSPSLRVQGIKISGK